jgi:hypothetical protein
MAEGDNLGLIEEIADQIAGAVSEAAAA